MLAVVIVHVSVTDFYVVSHLKQNPVRVKVSINVFNLTVLWQTEGTGILGEFEPQAVTAYFTLPNHF